MDFRISDIIESVANPNGRFRTLKSIYAITGDSGEPLFHTFHGQTTFVVVYAGKKYSMTCFAKQDSRHAALLSDIAAYTRNISSEYIMECLWLPAEMLVFGRLGAISEIDVFMEKMPEGRTCAEFVKYAVDNCDYIAICAVMKNIASLTAWLAANNFRHGMITPTNLHIAPSLAPVMTGYLRSGRGTAVNDIEALGSLCATIYTGICEPGIFSMLDDLTGTPAGLRGSIEYLGEQVEPAACPELYALLSNLMACNPDFGSITDSILQLAEVGIRKNILKSSVIGPNTKSIPDKYVFIGETRDSLMRAFDGQRWVYLDVNGNPVIDKEFIYATDFSEGRAVVETRQGFGLIDNDGDYLIAPLCDDIDWDSSSNRAVATIDGLSGIFGRDGRPLTGFIYDQILPASEGIYPVRKKGRYGYISRDGSVLVEPMYDDAMGFRDGVARVRIGNKEALIDRAGALYGNIHRNMDTAGPDVLTAST